MKRRLIALFIFSISSFCLFAQSKSKNRILSVTSPRMHGDDVVYIQEKLIEMGFTEIGDIDGYYGPKTETAVKEFQGIIGLEPSGIVTHKEYDFFKNKNAEIIIQGINVWKNTNYDYSEPEESYQMAGYPCGDIFIKADNTKYPSCCLLFARDFYSETFTLIKINKSTYFILNEVRHAVPDYGYGLNPYEDKEYEYTQTYKSMVFKNNVLYKMDGGELKKDEDSEMIKFINYGKTLL